MTLSISKQLLPIYDKPMIYYALSTLMLGGIRQILVISTPRDLPALRALLGDGGQWGIELSYAEQPRPEGIAQALLIAEPFLAGGSAALMLGDNVLFGHGLESLLAKAIECNSGATIFAHRVQDPERYGVVGFDAQGRPNSIEEKPKKPKSTWAITGLYLYDQDAVDVAKRLTPSSRGELEISDVNANYLARGRLTVEPLGRGFAWFDSGLPDSLLEAANYVATLEKRQGLKIACPEEIAFRRGTITARQLEAIAIKTFARNDYGQYLLRLLEEESKPTQVC